MEGDCLIRPGHFSCGSGRFRKTAVLVERIIRKITDQERPVDVDRLLVVTFTNASAAEMKHRIGEALEKSLPKIRDRFICADSLLY